MRADVLSLVAILAASASSTLTTTGRTVNLNGIDYYIPPTSVGSVELSRGPIWPGFFGGPKSPSLGNGLLPMTVVTGPSGFDAQSVANAFATADDVWQSGFLQGKSDLAWSSGCASYLQRDAQYARSCCSKHI
jgi:hypothetical protein